MPRRYVKRTRINAPPTAVFDWHTRPGAFERLAPPYEQLRVVSRKGTIRDGDELIFEVRMAPGVWMRWQARHYGFEPGKQFCDEQVQGPFAQWRHRHRVEAAEDGAGAVLVDEVEYSLPLEPLSSLAPRFMVEDKIDAMFEYRSRTIQMDVERHHLLGIKPMRIAMTGAGGLLGRHLASFLRTGGHEVIPMVRSRQNSQADAIVWSTREGLSREEATKLESVDAVIHLAGESIMGVWTSEKKAAIRQSRVEGTRRLATALAGLERKPKVLICASATGVYPDAGDRILDESAPPGTSFLSEVAREWEEAAEPAREAGIRTVHCRISMVLAGDGGALPTMKVPFSMGLAGRVGSGRQWMSWVALDDVIGIIHHALGNESISGPINTTSPNPVTNEEFTQTLARVLRRPAIFPMPEFAAKALPGGMGSEILLRSTRAVPRIAQDSGYRFAFPELEPALRHYLGRPGK